MLESSDLIAFIATTDLARAREFYEQKLGLPLTSQSDFAHVFDANGTMLRVTPVAEIPAVGYTVLGWRVTGIEATVRSLTAKDVVFKRYDGIGDSCSTRMMATASCPFFAFSAASS